MLPLGFLQIDFPARPQTQWDSADEKRRLSIGNKNATPSRYRAKICPIYQLNLIVQRIVNRSHLTTSLHTGEKNYLIMQILWK